MVDFRKAFLLLALMVFATGIASAQYNPLSCTANAGVPPLLRGEGLAEELGQVVINCTGGTPTVRGQAIPTVNVQIFLNQNITSKLMAKDSNATEALLLIDEPSPASQMICSAGSLCTVYSDMGDGTGNYTGLKGTYTRYNQDGTPVMVGETVQTGSDRPNVWQAVTTGQNNSIVWLGVPVDPPGTIGGRNRTLRLTNVRTNASAYGVAGSGIPTNVTMFISITGTGGLALLNPTITVGATYKGLDFSSTGGSFKLCNPGTYTTYVDSSGNTKDYFSVTWKEQFATAFRHNQAGVTTQSTPGSIYNTESMFSNQTNFSDAAKYTGSKTADGAGVATQGTRLIAQFTALPTNVKITALNTITNDDGDVAYLVTGSTLGWGGTVQTGGGSTTIIDGAGGATTLVYEVYVSNPGKISNLKSQMTVKFSSSPAPSLGGGAVTGSFAPIQGTTTWAAGATSPTSSYAPVPRFIDSAISKGTFSIVQCQTNLLFPFVTSVPAAGNDSGWDTGIAIANTSSDVFSTAPQRGTCTLYYFGSGAPTTAPVTPSIGEGTIYAFSIRGGSIDGVVKPIPSFSGYMIASCLFQYAHAYAFVSDGGATRVAEGYLALVLDGDLFSSKTGRTGQQSEILMH